MLSENVPYFQIWNMDSGSLDFTLDAHSKGINCIEYFMAGDKPFLISGSDDYTAKVCNKKFLVTETCIFSYKLQSDLNYAVEYDDQ